MIELASLPLTRVTHSTRETEDFARALGTLLQSGDVVACVGGMGMGKTAFAHGLAAGMGLSDDVASPTYAIVNEYTEGKLPLFHFDFYRLTSEADLEQTGFYEYLQRRGVIFVEWSEQLPDALPKPYYRLTFRRLDENSREITLELES